MITFYEVIMPNNISNKTGYPNTSVFSSSWILNFLFNFSFVHEYYFASDSVSLCMRVLDFIISIGPVHEIVGLQ